MAADNDFTGFDKAARGVIDAMLDQGWSARLSRNNHVILRSPDGTAAAVVPKDCGGRRARNYAAPFRRWQRAQNNQQQQSS